jgi:hypothetical protein
VRENRGPACARLGRTPLRGEKAAEGGVLARRVSRSIERRSMRLVPFTGCKASELPPVSSAPPLYTYRYSNAGLNAEPLLSKVCNVATFPAAKFQATHTGRHHRQVACEIPLVRKEPAKKTTHASSPLQLPLLCHSRSRNVYRPTAGGYSTTQGGISMRLSLWRGLILGRASWPA